MSQSIETDRRQELGIQEAIRRVADERGLTLAQSHHAQEFGCSNIYSLKEGSAEIVVINPFGFKYDVLAYASNREDEARLTSAAKELAVAIKSAPHSDGSLC